MSQKLNITNETALINAQLDDLQARMGVAETAKVVNAIRASTERLNALVATPAVAPIEPEQIAEPVAVTKDAPVKIEAVKAVKPAKTKAASAKAVVDKNPPRKRSA